MAPQILEALGKLEAKKGFVSTKDFHRIIKRVRGNRHVTRGEE